MALGEEPEKGASRSERPDAARLHAENPGASRRPPSTYSDQEFRRFCKLARDEHAAHPGLDSASLMDRLKAACTRAGLRHDSAVLGRVLDVVTPRERLVQHHAEPPRTHWRDRCAHTPRCPTPTQCALNQAKGK